MSLSFSFLSLQLSFNQIPQSAHSSTYPVSDCNCSLCLCYLFQRSTETGHICPVALDQHSYTTVISPVPGMLEPGSISPAVTKYFPYSLFKSDRIGSTSSPVLIHVFGVQVPQIIRAALEDKSPLKVDLCCSFDLLQLTD